MNKLLLIALLLSASFLTGCPQPNGSNLTEDQAIEIASSILPGQIVERSSLIYANSIQLLGPNGVWQVVFINANPTEEELNWQEGPDTIIERNNQPLRTIIILVDIQTGDILEKKATWNVVLGGPPPY